MPMRNPLSRAELVDTALAPAPPMWKDREKAAWDRARDQHVLLAKAAKMKPLEKGLITDGCRAQANVRWIERHSKVPDGPNVGKPFRLWEFQRDIIRGHLRRPCLLAGGRCRAEEETARRPARDEATRLGGGNAPRAKRLIIRAS